MKAGMRIVVGALLGIVLGACASRVVVAQTAAVPVSAVVSWQLPATTEAGEPLTGGNALTELRIWAASSSISDGSTLLPAVTLPPDATSWTYTTTAPNGSTLYFRAKACNVGGCSAFSNEAVKVVQVNVPGAPQGLSVAVSVVVTVSP